MENPPLPQCYAGFWLRLAATIIDSFLLFALILPVLFAIYGVDYFKSDMRIQGIWDLLLQTLVPLLITVWFWRRYRGTPGKVILKLAVVDGSTGRAMTRGQAVGRYFAYIASTLPLGLGFIWIAFDPKKRALHDLLCGTQVIEQSGPDRNSDVPTT